MPSEAELLEGLRDGSERAFRALVERYRDPLFRAAYRVLGNEEDALDVAQETFVRAHRSLGGFAGRSSLYTWLYRIARNLAVDRLRRGAARPQVSLEAKSDEDDRSLSERLAGNEAGPTDEAADREMMDKVRQAMDGLSEKHRIVLELREFEGLSYQEIADTVGCNVGTVMSRLYYARNALAERLRPYLEPGMLDGGGTA